jgi:hypothetical protein
LLLQRASLMDEEQEIGVSFEESIDSGIYWADYG